MSITEEAEEDIEAAKDELLDGEREIEVNIGPNGEGPPEIITVDFVEEVEYESVEDPDLGEIVEITVELGTPPWVYSGERHGNAVFGVTQEHGFDGPDGSYRHGVNIGSNSVTITNYYKLE